MEPAVVVRSDPAAAVVGGAAPTAARRDPAWARARRGVRLVSAASAAYVLGLLAYVLLLVVAGGAGAAGGPGFLAIVAGASVAGVLLDVALCVGLLHYGRSALPAGRAVANAALGLQATRAALGLYTTLCVLLAQAGTALPGIEAIGGRAAQLTTNGLAVGAIALLLVSLRQVGRSLRESALARSAARSLLLIGAFIVVLYALAASFHPADLADPAVLTLLLAVVVAMLPLGVVTGISFLRTLRAAAAVLSRAADTADCVARLD